MSDNLPVPERVLGVRVQKLPAPKKTILVSFVLVAVPPRGSYVVARALADDPSAARAEWLGEFREDIETFVPIETLTALVSSGVTERRPPPRRELLRLL
jgi:hypothetical protein